MATRPTVAGVGSEFIRQAASRGLSIQEWDIRTTNDTVRFAHEDIDFLVLCPDPSDPDFVFMQVPLEHALLCENYVDLLCAPIVNIHINKMLDNDLANALFFS